MGLCCGLSSIIVVFMLFLSKQRCRLLPLAAILLLLTACHPGKVLQFGITVCDQQRALEIYLPAPAMPYPEAQIDTALTARLSLGDLNAAYAIGVLQPLSEYVAIQKAGAREATLENRLRLMELSQQISRRISLASMEIAAVSWSWTAKMKS